MSIQLTGADVIDLAVQTEIRGEKFYREALAIADRAEAKSLFGYLAQEEVRHKQVFEGLSPSIVITETDPTTWDDVVEYIHATVDSAFFSRADAPIRLVPQGATVNDMVRMAINFEKQTLLYFYTLRDLVQLSSRPLIDRIVEEEKSHIRRLVAWLSDQPST
jgi:rubrerythrin